MNLNTLHNRYGTILVALDRFNDPVSAVRTSYVMRETDPAHIRNVRLKLLTRLFGESFAKKLLDDPAVTIKFYPNHTPLKVEIRTRSTELYQHRISTAAHTEGGCIYIVDETGGDLILPGPDTRHNFYTVNQKSVLAAPVGLITDGVPTVEDVQLLSFPRAIYIRACDELRCLSFDLPLLEGEEGGVGIMSNTTMCYIIRRDMNLMEMVNMGHLINAPLRNAIAALRAAFEVNLDALKDLWTPDALNPEFVDLYSRIVQDVVQSSEKGALKPLTGRRLFATWTEAMHYRPSEYAVLLDIQNVRL